MAQRGVVCVCLEEPEAPVLSLRGDVTGAMPRKAADHDAPTGLLSPIMASTSSFGNPSSPTGPYTLGRRAVQRPMPLSPSPTMPSSASFYTPPVSPIRYDGPTMPTHAPALPSPDMQQARFDAFLARMKATGSMSASAMAVSPSSQRSRSGTLHSPAKRHAVAVDVSDAPPTPPVPTISAPAACLIPPPRPPRSLRRRSSVGSSIGGDEPPLALPSAPSPVLSVAIAVSDPSPSCTPSPSRQPIVASASTTIRRRREASVMPTLQESSAAPPSPAFSAAAPALGAQLAFVPIHIPRTPPTPTAPSWAAATSEPLPGLPIRTPERTSVSYDDWVRDRRMSSLFSGLGLGPASTSHTPALDSEDEGINTSDCFESADEGEEDVWMADGGPDEPAQATAPCSPLDLVGSPATATRSPASDTTAAVAFGYAIEAGDDVEVNDGPVSSVRPRSVHQLVRQSWRSSLIQLPLDNAEPGPIQPTTPPPTEPRTTTTPNASATADLIDSYAASPGARPPSLVLTATRPHSRRGSIAASTQAVEQWLPTVERERGHMSAIDEAPPSPVPSLGESKTGSSVTSSSSSSARTSWLADTIETALPSPHIVSNEPAAPQRHRRDGRRSISFSGELDPSRRLSQSFSSLSEQSLGKQGKRRSRTRSTIEEIRAAAPVPPGLAGNGTSRSARRRSLTTSVLLADIPSRASSVAGPRKSRKQQAPPPPSPTSSLAGNGTWRSTLTDVAYEGLLARFGPTEMRRQDVIWELCETEIAFVDGLRAVVRLFSQPLRSSGGVWLRGVPSTVARLFDWLDDIVNVHSTIAASMQAARDAQQPIVSRMADVFLPFVPKLEVHQPYIIFFEAVTRTIEGMIADEASDFGEFVRMQQLLPECGAMPLSSFLLKPVQRLMKYPLFFKQMSELTPASHPDHLATHSLLRSTDAIIRVMQDVKAGEDEFDHVSTLATRLRGLPDGFVLARRDRRLIAHGELKRIHISDKDRALLDMEAISALHRAPLPPHGRSPGASETETASEASSAHNSPGSTMSTVRGSPSQLASFLRQRNTSSSQPRETAQQQSSRLKTRARESAIHAFVFSDLVIFATVQSSGGIRLMGRSATKPSSPRQAAANVPPQETYRLIEGCGIARIMSISDLTGRTEHDHLLEVDVLPISSDDDDNAAFISLSSAALATTMFLSIAGPARPTGSETTALIKERQRWRDAFDSSCQQTLRSLSSERPTTLSSRQAAASPRSRPHDDNPERTSLWAPRMKRVASSTDPVVDMATAELVQRTLQQQQRPALRRA